MRAGCAYGSGPALMCARMSELGPAGVATVCSAPQIRCPSTGLAGCPVAHTKDSLRAIAGSLRDEAIRRLALGQDNRRCGASRH